MAAIQSALDTCPNDQTVLLSEGTYTLTGTLVIPSYVTLRGAGPGRTILDMRGSGGSAVRFGADTGANANTSTSISGGASAGSTSIGVASASGISAGKYLAISQLNDPTFVSIAGENGACTWCDGGWNGTRTLGQIVEVTSVSGNTVNFTPPLYFTYSSALSPIANPFSAGCKYGGVESLTLRANNTGYGANFKMPGSAYCWIKNVESDFADGDHANIYWSFRCEARDSFFHDGYSHGPGGHDDDLVLAYKSTACLVENNIFWRQHVSVMLEWGAAGNVIAYNYSTNNYHDQYLPWCINDFNFHGAHPMFNLFEGNIGVTFRPDATWGSSSHSTILRNWFAGSDYFQPPVNTRGPVQTTGGQWESASAYSFAIDYLSLSNHLVGNIGGSAWVVANGGASLVVAPSGNSDPSCFRFGFTSGNDIAQNSRAFTTAIFHGNYDFVSRQQQWDSNIADHNIPNSLYLAGRPTWFGAGKWPPIDPTSPSSLNVTNLPAAYRFYYGSNPPSGPVNRAPIVAATASPTIGLAPLTVQFSSAGSSDPEGARLTYSWTFGDGSAASTSSNTVHTYSADGSFTAKLTVSDGTNSTVSSNLVIRVGNQVPTVVATANPTAGVMPLTVAFSSAGSSDPEGATLSYNWTFGDGTTSTLPNPNHTYSVKGLYAARLVVSDGVKTNSSSDLAISVIDPAASLVAALSFDEGLGNTVADASGNGNSGTITSAVWTNTGRFGKALAFSSGSLVTVNDSPFLDLTNSMTLEAWVFPQSAGNSWMNLIVKTAGDPASTSPAYVLQGATPPNQVPSLYVSPGSGNLLSASALPLNAWSHLAATYDGAVARLFVNGTEVASRPQTGSMTVSADPLTIGGNTYSGQNWSGLIDEVRIYNRALSSTEIQTDMTTPITVRVPTPPLNIRIEGP